MPFAQTDSVAVLAATSLTGAISRGLGLDLLPIVLIIPGSLGRHPV